uniref:Syndecan/Neurexin domain-containing protein n=1 Tax=Magallana gigas TaxID=29159 RepID=A0A8W8JLD2_MAGGI|nr:mucin-5AC [Crassostrea gigas]
MEKISLLVGFILIFYDVYGSPYRENRYSRLSAASVSPAQSFADPTNTNVPKQTSVSTIYTTVSESVTMTTPGLTTGSAYTSMSNPVTMTTSGQHNSTTEPITSNVTTVFPNMTTQPTTNSSSESPSAATTSSSHNTSESTKTSSIPHTIPHTTSSAPKPAKKSKFEAWSFLGGAAVGLCVTLACVGLMYCIIDRTKYPHDSVQYRAM